MGRRCPISGIRAIPRPYGFVRPGDFDLGVVGLFAHKNFGLQLGGLLFEVGNDWVMARLLVRNHLLLLRGNDLSPYGGSHMLGVSARQSHS